MKISAVIEKMISVSEGNMHDINHFMKVYAFAKTIGEQEELDATTQETLEIAAIVHDIACPLCREKYGNTNGKYQEVEGVQLTHQFLTDLSIPETMRDRIVWLVGHHHTYKDVVGLDYQILLEADFLVNAEESSMTKAAIEQMLEMNFKTETGKRLLKSMYLRE